MERIIDLYKKMYHEYTLAICEVEIQLHKARVTRMKGKLQTYFNSSQNRNTFARIMCKAFATDTPVSITEICETLVANRSSVSIMVDECEKEGWISVTRVNNKALCMATEELHRGCMRYAHWKKQISRSIIGKKYDKLIQLESMLREMNIEIPDFSYGEPDIQATTVELLMDISDRRVG